MRRGVKWIIPAAVLVIAVGAVLFFRSRMIAFSDLSLWDKDYLYARDVVREGIMEPMEDGRFGPDEPVTMGQAMTLMLRTLGADEEPLAQQAVASKLVYVFEADSLDRPCTRLEAAQMAARGLQLLPMGWETCYSDCDDGYAAMLRQQKIWDCGTEFCPDEPMTRMELAKLLWNMNTQDYTEGLFRYNNYWIRELEGVPLYDYDPDLFRWEDDRPVYTGSGYRTLRGIDVSGYQKEIDWEAVAADGIEFAVIRAGGRFIRSGEMYDDSMFERNMEGALAAGLDVGVYVFSQAITVEEGLEEAEYLLGRIEGYDVTMPVIIDWEYLGGSEARTYGVEPKEITAAIDAFCRRVREAGYEPMIYFNAYCGYIKMDLSQLTDYGFWYAQYSACPRFRYQFQMWQYSETGQVDGISTNVDMDLYFVPEF